MAFRRVITGHDNGKAVIVADEQVDSITAGGFSYDAMWSIDGESVVPNDGSIPRGTFFPTVGGARVITWVAQPAGVAAPAVTVEEMEAAAPGLAAHMEPDHPGMHTTDTIDVDVILSGELWMELDDGVTTHLHAGDVVVQNGTRHRWENRSSSPTVVLSVMVGARRA